MSLELLAVLETFPSRMHKAPRLRVRCRRCLDVYVVATWVANLRRPKHCRACECKRRSAKARRR